MRFVHAAIAVLLVAAVPVARGGDAPPPRPSKVADLAWLAGTWASDDGAFDEHWLPPRAEAMYAVSRLVKGDRTVMVELSSIERVGDAIALHLRHHGAALRPAPGEETAMSFPLASLGEREVAFADPAREFPRRVVYRREGDRLTVRLEGEHDGKPVAQQFGFRLVEGERRR